MGVYDRLDRLGGFGDIYNLQYSLIVEQARVREEHRAIAEGTKVAERLMLDVWETCKTVSMALLQAEYAEGLKSGAYTLDKRSVKQAFAKVHRRHYGHQKEGDYTPTGWLDKRIEEVVRAGGL